MPWKESALIDERMKFVGRLLEGEKMAELCREFGISRKTGYKFWDRYQRIGLQGLSDRRISRAFRRAGDMKMARTERLDLGETELRRWALNRPALLFHQMFQTLKSSLSDSAKPPYFSSVGGA